MRIADLLSIRNRFALLYEFGNVLWFYRNVLYLVGGVACDYGVRRHIFGNDRAGTHYTAFAYRYAV